MCLSDHLGTIEGWQAGETQPFGQVFECLGIELAAIETLLAGAAALRDRPQCRKRLLLGR
jgi:hypothetical protein